MEAILTLEYAFFDPGEKTGYAAFDENGDVCGRNTIRGETGLFEFLQPLGEHFFKPKLIGIEDFKLFP